MKSHSFRNRLLASFLVASLVPMLICSVLLFQISRLQMDSRSKADAQVQAENVCQSLDRIAQALTQSAAALQGDPVLARALSGSGGSYTSVNNALFRATDSFRDLGVFQLYDLQGRQRYSTQSVTTGDSLPLRWGVLYAAAQSGGEPVYAASQDPENTDAPLLRAAALLKDAAGDPMGYLVLGMDQQDFRSLFEGTFGAQNDILILNRFWRSVYASQSLMTAQLAPRLRQQLLSGQEPGAGADEFVYSVMEHPATGLYLVLQQPQMFTKSTMQMLYTASFLCALIGVAISVALCLPLSRQISRPIRRLQQAFSRLEQDDLNVQVRTNQNDELGQLAQEFNHMVSALKYNREELVKNQRELNEAQVRMLQAQLNPHFLCNTLDTMKWISKINHVPQVALMSTNLADILRFCISAEEFVPLSREVAVLERYIEIQKIRLSDKFAFSVTLPEDLSDCLVPKMILQPIVENAILHGLEGVENSAIRVEARQETEDMLAITVTDNGHGLPPGMAGHPYHRPAAQEGKHLGLYNVDTILKKHYGEDFGLYLDNGPDGKGACVTARLPVRRKENVQC
ncbi:MAG: histidine kinase [Faecousia sp.]